MLAFADDPIWHRIMTQRVCYDAKGLFVEKEIPQGAFSIPHASLIPRKRWKTYVELSYESNI